MYIYIYMFVYRYYEAKKCSHMYIHIYLIICKNTNTDAYEFKFVCACVHIWFLQRCTVYILRKEQHMCATFAGCLAMMVLWHLRQQGMISKW